MQWDSSVLSVLCPVYVYNLNSNWHKLRSYKRYISINTCIDKLVHGSNSGYHGKKGTIKQTEQLHRHFCMGVAIPFLYSQGKIPK